MSHDDEPALATGEPSATPEDRRLEQVLDGYLADLEAGRPPDPDRLLAENPGLAGPLRACLAVFRMADAVAAGPSGASRTASIAGGEPRPSGESLLTALWSDGEPPPRVLLRDPPGEDGPPVSTRSCAMPQAGPGGHARYQLLGEIARGGMGAVLKGRDVDLGRDLAIKVQLEAHRDDPEMLRRFVEEAQIGGQLQHPGIVPVYELGTFADDRAFFAMKLVQGRTLAALLRERSSPAHDLPRFLTIFEQACQTMAYAHARGVIHRDLKPSNVMVGSYGEVQVMDWGLAKVLKEGGAADEGRPAADRPAAVRTSRSGPGGAESRAGSVMGTPSYMAPEQARGETDRLDERCDVFGLGAILCEVLTGAPPFAGEAAPRARDQAERGDLAGALARLDASGAEPELLGLARACLAAEPAARPRDAREVAARMRAHLSGVQDRLRAAELARAEAQARAESERARRRMTAAFAAAALGLILCVGGGGGWWAYGRQARAARADVALGNAEVLRAEADRAGDDASRWSAAREAVKHLGPLLDEARDAATRARALALIAAVDRGAGAAAADRELLDELVAIGAAVDEGPDEIDARYAEAFRGRGIDPEGPAPGDAGRAIAGRPPRTALELAAALDAWAAARRAMGERAGAGRIAAVARRADPDAWRGRLRVAMTEPDRTARQGALRRLAREAPTDAPAVSANLLGAALLETDDPAEAEVVLRPARGRRPGDVRLNVNLARAVKRLNRLEEAIGYYMAAQASRPEAAHELAHALQDKGETNRAIDVFRDLARRRPDVPNHRSCLVLALRSRGRAREADEALEGAVAAARRLTRLKPENALAHAHLGAALRAGGDLVGAAAEYRQAIRLKPDGGTAHISLGNALRDSGDFDGAVAEHRLAIRLVPNNAGAHLNLGVSLGAKGDVEGAAAEYREAIRLEPDLAMAHYSLAVLLAAKGDLDGAVAEYRVAIRLKPDLAEAHNNLGTSLKEKGDVDGAVAEYRVAIRLKPDLAEPHSNLGDALLERGNLDGAVAEHREAIRLKPDLAMAHSNLGDALRAKGDVDGAAAEYRVAIRLKPDLAEPHNGLGAILCDVKHEFAAAAVEFREAIRLRPDYAMAHNNLGSVLRDTGDIDGAIAEFRQAIRLKPDLAMAHRNLGAGLAKRGDIDGAIAEFREAIRLEPDLAAAHCNLGSDLMTKGDIDGAIAGYREAIRLKPDLADAHYNLGNILQSQGMLDEAVDAYRRAIRLKPDHAEAHCNLGGALRRKGEYAESLAEYRRGHELGSKQPNWSYPSAAWVRQAETRAALASRLPGMLRGDDKVGGSAEGMSFAQFCYEKGMHAAAAGFFGQALDADPKLADDRQAQHLYNAACAAALAGCGKGKDDPPPDEAARTRLRGQALSWLKAEIAAWSHVVKASTPQARSAVVEVLRHWRRDVDLAGVRDPGELAKLPRDEQAEWRALWAEVDALSSRARTGVVPSPDPTVDELPADPFGPAR